MTPAARGLLASVSGQRRRWLGPGRRGLTPVIGVVMLTLIVVLGSIAVFLTGGPALVDTRQSVDVARAEQAMGEVDASVSATALDLDGTATRDVDFGRIERGGTLGTNESSWLRVDLIDTSTGGATEVVNASLGTVVYSNGDTTVGYEGGGVWRADRDGSVMLSPPEFHFREDRTGNGTLTLPILSVSGERGLSDRLRVERVGQPERVYPDESANFTNKVQQTKVRVTVRSEYYEAWGRYFERNTDGFVFVDPATETASVTFLSLPRFVGLNSGIVATSGLGEIKLNGNSIYIDSYDSRVGTYEETKGAQGSITAVNDVVTTGSSNIQGEIRSGATVELSGTTDVNGTVYWTDEYISGGAYVSGGDEQIPGVANIEPIDGFVYEAVADVRETNDNDATGVVVDRELTGSGTLTTGSYYLQNLAIGPGETLTLDTTDGDIVLAVEDIVSIVGNGNSAARIDVVGDGTVTVYVVGDDPVDFEIDKNGEVDVPVQRSGQFRIYGTQDFDAVITSNQGNKLLFEGVIYAPAGRTGSGSVQIGQAAYYGAIVTGDLTIKQGAEIHYDLGLADQRFPRSPTVSRLEFMHVTKHLVRVTG